LAELLILSSGSLKEIAKRLQISYPTIRRRLDELIRALDIEIRKDQHVRHRLLKDVAAGKRSVAEARKRLKAS